jgi:tryptophan synthase alpha subunit
MKIQLMTHVVAGYPDKKQCIELILGMQSVGVFAIEVQIPFSDPTADGPVIMGANDIALQNGMTTRACLEMITNAQKQGLNTPIYLMSYVNKLYSFGFEKLCKEAHKSGTNGLIIPDLPFGTPEYSQLAEFCKSHSLDLVPVVSPGIAQERLKEYLKLSPDFMYLTSTKGTTGKNLSIQKELIQLIAQIRATSKCEIGLGFGIRTSEHVNQALKIADVAIVGSEVIRNIDAKGVSGAIKFVKNITTHEVQ